MKIDSIRMGQELRHPQYGTGVVTTIRERIVEIQFADGRREVSPETSGLAPVNAQAAVTGLEVPLEQIIRDVVESTVNAMGLERPGDTVDGLLRRWNNGRLVMHPEDPTLQTKEVPIEAFFHKIVMMRNNLRVLEQKINAHPVLTDAEKVEMQQYITRCHGSMTTFNILFAEKADQFGS